MTRNELIEKVALAILHEQQTNRSAVPDNRDLAQAAISTILAALQEPSKAMLSAAEKEDRVTDFVTYSDYWRSMLAASALGEQSE